jgi:hypothetical protein
MKNKSDYHDWGPEFLKFTDNLIEWETYDPTKKLTFFSNNTCHELNYFIYKRDKPFFDSFVKTFIQNKMEKTFVDWFLLDVDSPGQTFFTKQILSYLDDFCDISSLNAFEICLLFETAFKKGDAK